jgi:hypothetical protein
MADAQGHENVARLRRQQAALASFGAMPFENRYSMTSLLKHLAFAPRVLEFRSAKSVSIVLNIMIFLWLQGRDGMKAL